MPSKDRMQKLYDKLIEAVMDQPRPTVSVRQAINAILNATSHPEREPIAFSYGIDSRPLVTFEELDEYLGNHLPPEPEELLIGDFHLSSELLGPDDLDSFEFPEEFQLDRPAVGHGYLPEPC